MIFNTHSTIVGKHAFLSPSQYHWINYNAEKLEARFIKSMAARRGTELHEFAHMAIKLGIKLPKVQQTLNMYVNDGIGFKMSPEQPLFYSVNCFGHADTISFRQELLRIHDLKTGTIKASPEQLVVYAAIFCLEYSISPTEIGIELRIYQNNECLVYAVTVEEVLEVMDKIVEFDERIEILKGELS